MGNFHDLEESITEMHRHGANYECVCAFVCIHVYWKESDFTTKVSLAKSQCWWNEVCLKLLQNSGACGFRSGPLTYVFLHLVISYESQRYLKIHRWKRLRNCTYFFVTNWTIYRPRQDKTIKKTSNLFLKLIHGEEK